MELGRDGKPEKRGTHCEDAFKSPCRDLRIGTDGRRIRSCPKGTPESPKTLSAENELCYEHFLECQAVGSFPDDSVVRRNAKVIIEVLAEEKRSLDAMRHSSLLTYAGAVST